MEAFVDNDPFKYLTDSPMTPASRCVSITPDDAFDLATPTKAIYVGDAGDITLTALNDTSEVVFRNVGAGTILDIRVKAVKATGTTATSLIGLY